MKSAKLKVKLLSLMLLGLFAIPTLGGQAVSAKILHCTDDVTNSGARKYAVVATSTDGTDARASVVIEGSESDVQRVGHAQTDQVRGWRWSTAYIGHGENGVITTAYER